MITNQKIRLQSARQNSRNEVVVEMVLNAETIKTLEDIAHTPNLSYQQVAAQAIKLLENSIFLQYTRGGQRRKYD